MHKHIHFFLWVLGAQLALSTTAAAGEWQFEDVARVVAIADIHGAYEPMVAGLQHAGVLDEQLAWSAVDAHLVIVGDILDRGPRSRDAMDLLMRIEDEAATAGGKVHVLIGNHEAMNLVGDLRYVSAAEYAAFADDEAPEERQRWFEAFTEKRSNGDESDEALRTIFKQKYPAGYFAHRRAFSTGGTYGEWLLSKPVVVVINGTAFVHGGLSPMVAETGLDGTNERLRGEMVEYVRQLEVLYGASVLLPTDNFHDHKELLNAYMPSLDTGTNVLDAMKAVKSLYDSNLYSLKGPLWYRGNVVCSELIEEDKLAETLEAIGAKRVVIGHTPTPGRSVLERIGGQIIQIDTGMLKNYYGGKASVLTIENDTVSVTTEKVNTPVPPLPHPREVGARPGGAISAQTIERLLSSGEVVATNEDEQGREIVTISDGKRTIEAFFAQRRSRGFYPEAAAYRLDLLLGLDMVPVAVRREVNGDDGTLQFRPKNWIDETERSRDGRGGGAWCPLDEQWNAMFVFDTLLRNPGRNGSNLLYNLDMWQLMLIDHSRAFVAKKGMPSRLESVPFVVGQAWKDALASLTDDVLQEQLGDVLDKKRLRSLVVRRDELIERP